MVVVVILSISKLLMIRLVSRGIHVYMDTLKEVEGRRHWLCFVNWLQGPQYRGVLLRISMTLWLLMNREVNEVTRGICCKVFLLRYMIVDYRIWGF